MRLEPLAALEWSNAIAITGSTPAKVEAPAQARHAWVHSAPEAEVVALYLASMAADPNTEAPWWLEPLATGRIPDRATAFAIEDRVAALLGDRPGWVFTPWGADGCWEYLPSERWGRHPTVLQCTSRHEHWLDLVPAHEDHGAPPAPLAIAGVEALRADLDRIETR